MLWLSTWHELRNCTLVKLRTYKWIAKDLDSVDVEMEYKNVSCSIHRVVYLPNSTKSANHSKLANRSKTIAAMADPLSKHYITTDLQGMFDIDQPLKRTAFGITDCGNPSVDKLLSFQVHQDPHTHAWSFQCKLLQDFVTFYTSPIGGSSIGLAQGRYKAGEIKLTSDDSTGWDPPIDRTYGIGSYRLVLGSLLNSEGGTKELRGPKDEDDDRDHPMTIDHIYTVYLDCDAATAAHIKASEREHVDDFHQAYDLLFKGFIAAASGVKPQSTQDGLWKELYHTLSAQGNPLRGTVPASKTDFNKIASWKAQILAYYHELCDLSYVRDKGMDATHAPAKWLAVWAAAEAWKDTLKIPFAGIKEVEAKPWELNLSVLTWPQNSQASSAVVSSKTALTTPAAKRLLAAV